MKNENNNIVSASWGQIDVLKTQDEEDKITGPFSKSKKSEAQEEKEASRGQKGMQKEIEKAANELSKVKDKYDEAEKLNDKRNISNEEIHGLLTKLAEALNSLQEGSDSSWSFHNKEGEDLGSSASDWESVTRFRADL